MTQKITRLKDIAAKLNISTATVSLALNKHPRIPVSTRRKVEAVAKELSYTPNPLVAQLASSRWRPSPTHTGTVIGFVKVDYLARNRVDPWTGILRGASGEAKEKGYRVESFNLCDYPSSTALDRVLYSRGIKGLLIGRIYDLKPKLALNWKRYSAVCCGESVYPLQLNGVMPNHFNAVLKAWQQLKKNGYRRIGIILYNLPQRWNDDDLRVGATYAELQHTSPHESVPPLILKQLDESAILSWYRLHKPEAVIGMNSHTLETLQRGGLSCPRDFAFASLHVAAGEKHSGIASIEEALGKSAFSLLLNQMNINLLGKAPFPMWHELEPIWISGETCPPKSVRKR